MKRTILYFFIGTILKFLLDYFIFGVEQWEIELLYAIAFGLGWGLAYFVDRPNWKLAKKMGLSFVGVVVLLVFGGCRDSGSVYCEVFNDFCGILSIGEF